jgi:hypothetical protein
MVKLIFRTAFLLLAMVVWQTVCAEELRLEGVVSDAKTGKPLPNVLVTVRPAGKSNVLKFTQTTSEGRFELLLKSSIESHELSFRMMGYASQSVGLSEGKTFYRISMVEQATSIREVVVKSKGISQKGDTVTYLVSNFANAQDKTLADVLKKMPGIEVSKSGAITYNGVSLNRFYIEGKDMLGGRYGLATNSINQQDVGSVEVMENHQPIKALNDISFSKNPAINIRLKSDAKSRWVGTVKGGLGAEPTTWKGEVLAMRFTAKNQSLNTYKSNNVGSDITSETQSLAFEDIVGSINKGYRLSAFIDLSPDFIKEIDESRYLFNKTHLISTNNLWSLGKNYDLTSQVSYTNNRITSDSYSNTMYYLPDKVVEVRDDQHAFSRKNNVMANMVLTANTPTFYLKNTLNVNLKWNETQMGVDGTYPNRQRASTPHHQLSNDFDLISRKGNSAFTVNSFTLYQTRNEELLVSGKDTQQQTVTSSALFTNTSTSFSVGIKPVTISGKVGISGLLRKFNSNLSGISDTIGRLQNKVQMNCLNIYFTPKMEFKRTAVEASLECPLSIMPYNFRDKLADNSNLKTKMNVSPYLYVKYYATPRLSFMASGQFSQSKVDEQLFYGGIILNDYRNISKGIVDYAVGNVKSISGSISYKIPLKGFFVNAGTNRSWNTFPRMFDRSFEGQYVVNSIVKQSNNNRRWSIYGSVSKRVEGIRGVVTLRSSYSSSDASLLQLGVKNSYNSSVCSVSGKITSNIGSWSNLAYDIIYDKNWLRFSLGHISSTYEGYNQKLTYTITPNECWYLRIIGEHYVNEVAEGVKKNFFLSDVDITYCLKKGWELNLKASNIFDQKNYSYSYYNGLSNVGKSYNVRGRNVMVSLFFRF